MKKLDIILVVIFLLVGFVCLFFTNFFSKTGDIVYIYVDGKEYGQYPLSDNVIININNGECHNEITISDGSVFMSESNCLNRICIDQGRINMSNEAICCAPNKVIVRIGTSKLGEYDAITH